MLHLRGHSKRSSDRLLRLSTVLGAGLISGEETQVLDSLGARTCWTEPGLRQLGGPSTQAEATAEEPGPPKKRREHWTHRITPLVQHDSFATK